jgi:phenylpropionate dioxygenase-like ring-hydroxylating dioxygenase large terminal subunit
MATARPGDVFETSPHIHEIDYDKLKLKLRISTDRFHSRDYSERERDALWMKVWQIAGREDDLPDTGDWMEYRIFDQSFVLARGRDGVIRGFVNACRHRGNAFCQGKGNAARFTCPYHNWSYGLDGKCLSVAKPDYKGTVEEFVGDKAELGLIDVPVECFSGFVFINPDRDAEPLRDFFDEAYDILAAYHLEEMVPAGMNVREPIRCNWKVVMDAFYESYHVQAVHPELIPLMDLARERYGNFGRHGATTVPFNEADPATASPEEQVAAFRNLPEPNFPGLAEVFPRYDELVDSYRGEDGKLSFPEGVTGKSLLQRAVREHLTGKGLDVSGLTDRQLSDYQFWSVFPNVYIQLRAGEATVIIARPHPDGDPNRCVWHVCHYIWFPPDVREDMRVEMTEIPEGKHVPYFLALEQDFSQMEDQQLGLRNMALDHMSLTRQEPKVAQFHTALDAWYERAG